MYENSFPRKTYINASCFTTVVASLRNHHVYAFCTCDINIIFIMNCILFNAIFLRETEVNKVYGKFVYMHF